ncbi:ABC transporter permease [Rosenbergiella collisarenosi]|uniref:ABC transporter permease n=1 Tax=Rosenbergiella collisarenosi TaxID=1544695 RepID=UPI001BDAA8C7|nr:ABC transporter permease [Rosenbergiella collisarenosi]
MNYNWSVFFSMFRANLKEYTRDILPFLFSFIMPVFFIVAYGVSKNGTQTEQAFSANVAIIGSANDTAKIEEKLKDFTLFKIQVINSIESADTLIASGKYQAVVSVLENSTPQVASTSQYLNVATLIKKTLQGEVMTHASSTDIPTRVVSDNRIAGLDYSFAAILSLSLLQVALFGTAAPVVTAKEKGLYRLFKIIPVPRMGLLGAQVAVRFFVSMLQLLVLTAIAVFVFNVPVKYPVTFIMVISCAALTLVNYGYAIAGFFNRMSMASAFLIVLNFYCIFFGQMFSDINGSSWQLLVYTTPVGFISEALHYATTGYASMFTIFQSMTGMLIYLLVSCFIGIRFFSFEPGKA